MDNKEENKKNIKDFIQMFKEYKEINKNTGINTIELQNSLVEQLIELIAIDETKVQLLTIQKINLVSLLKEKGATEEEIIDVLKKSIK